MIDTAPNGFVWYELVTSDPDAAVRFYRDVVGWTDQPSPVPGMAYTVMQAGAYRAAGIMPIPPEMATNGGRPGWIGYVGVSDVDAAAAALAEAGGRVHRAPADIPGIGRFAIVADPQGAAFALFQPFGGDAARQPYMTPGTIGWHELYATDWEAAFAFYEGLFGWTKDTAIPMGSMGTYQLFAAGGAAIGGMMNRGELVPAPVWGFYFVVPTLDDAAAHVTAGGGRITTGPMEVPGGAWIVNGLDPQGAAFSLVAPKR